MNPERIHAAAGLLPPFALAVAFLLAGLGTGCPLTELLRTLDQTVGSINLARLSAQGGPVAQQAQAGGKEITEYALRKGVLFVAVVLVAALAYHFFGARLARTSYPQTNPS